VCRKVHEAVRTNKHQIEIWGDGQQTRSFTYIDDCVDGIERLMKSDFREPINLGSTEMVTINELVSLVEGIAGIKLERRYDLSAPKGVRGRNSENTLIRAKLGWEPSTSLRKGLTETFNWIGEAMDGARTSPAPKAPAPKSAAKKDGKHSAEGRNSRRVLVGKA
jgi:nucleoside-diphosphate-sugar epimerase